ncbi:FecR family protein [Chitinophaga alhagiae]|uniref:FecR family protein n=1 Tax=Chitinophaga alhagiae TaxID=2203219 RepID=UPI000E5BED70|nr:FecR domain-containing protein [Chitinophaga alhagiae]
MSSDQQRIHSLLHKYGRQQCTPEELAELESWYASLGGGSSLPFPDAAAELAVKETLWQQINRSKQPARSFRLPVWARVAAIALPLAAGAWFLLKKTPAPATVTAARADARSITTPYGATRQATLPDGTEVWLNAGSSLTYGPGFGDSQREVTLSGEAFFDVEKDAGKPFVIHTGKMDIRVLGTAFNVKAYPNDQTHEASLIRGAIEVSPLSHPDKKVLLKPNEKIVLPNQPLTTSPGMLPEEGFKALQRDGYALAAVSVNPADRSVAETAWVTNRLAFMNESFQDIALRLERKFEVKIVFADSSASALRFTATFEDENIRETLEALQYTAPFNFRIDRQTIYITR